MKSKSVRSHAFEVSALLALTGALAVDVLGETHFTLTFIVFIVIAVGMLCLDAWNYFRS